MWKFKPILKTTIWGGEQIAPFKQLSTGLHNIGESWELSGVEGDESVVADGVDVGLTLSQLVDKYKENLLGAKNYNKFANRFPLLIKFIDARDDLSVQVHPDDALAQKRGMANGKTEMWYVVKADKGARLANGFNRVVDSSEYEGLVDSGEIEKVLNFENIAKGDVFFIPAGRVHAIGKGAFVAEIQQTSDATYRIYDYHRKDKEGKERQLHTELAKDAIRFGDTDGAAVKYKAVADIPVNVVKSPFFTTNLLVVDHEVMRDYKEKDTFVVIIVTEGKALLSSGGEKVSVHAGETVLIPASAKGLIIEPEGRFTALETYIA